MSDFYIPKIRAAVRLSQQQRAPRDGWFLLYPDVRDAGRPETVLELLNSARLVIPFLQQEDNRVLLLVRENIDWVAVGAGTSDDLVFPPGRRVGLSQRVELAFIGEQKIAATIHWTDVKPTMRLSDFLDSQDPFVAAETGFGQLLVNKRRIREVHIVEGDER